MEAPGSKAEITYEIDREMRLVRVVCIGEVGLELIEACMRSVDADPDYELDFDGIIDLRNCTLELDSQKVRHLAMTIRAYPGSPGARRAVVAASDAQFGLMRMLEGHTSLAPVIYRAFRSEEMAMDWLAERKRKRSDE